VVALTDAQLALVAAFSAAILTAFGSRWVAAFQARKDAEQRTLDRELEIEQSRLADLRSLRDQKLARLRRDYEDVSFAATEIQNATIQLAFVEGGDTREKVNERVNERLNDATRDLGRAIHRLRLEGAEELSDRYVKVRGLWSRYAREYAQYLVGDRLLAGPIGVLEEMQAEVDAMFDMTKTGLADLSKPI
jgi:hypothetical protein